MGEFGLYGYQEEVVERALQKENVIIWLPTGGGKTRCAVYVAKRHLETTPQAKVVVLVNRVHLVEQHYNKEFRPHLGSGYTLTPVSGDTEQKDFFGKVMQDSDVIICTAQILYNALISKEEAKHAELSDITLLIIDECHHTQKETIYNKIMRLYVEKKLEKGRLPQILGLTASPGTGGAKCLQNAVEHVLQICANLDSAIVSSKNYAPELERVVPKPVKRFDVAEPRPEDPFGEHLKQMMKLVHEFMNNPPDLRECGTQEYEADVVTLEKRGVSEDNRTLAQCAIHLRKYNNALLINDTLRMMDAYNHLEEFYSTKVNSAIDGTDIFLLRLFQKNRVALEKIARDSRYENPKMDKLQTVLLKQFGHGVKSRGILFSKTRESTHRLHDWVLTNTALQEAGIEAAVFTGTGTGGTHMTQHEQGDTIRNFRQGKLNLLIATSVAEEGLDIPECNLVVRYGLLTNEIAQQQAIGRARAPDSQYSVVAQAGGREQRRECVNEYLEELTDQAIEVVQAMSPEAFHDKIAQLQKAAVAQSKLAENCKATKRSCYTAESVRLLCRNCFKSVAQGNDIKLIDNTLYVNISPDFRKHYKFGGQVTLQRTFEDWEPGRTVHCNSGNCNMKWGYEVKYKEAATLPNLSIKNFALETPDGRKPGKKWKDVPFTVDEFSFEEYCENNPDLLDDDGDDTD